MTWGLMLHSSDSPTSRGNSRCNVGATRLRKRGCFAFYCVATHQQLFPVFEWHERAKEKFLTINPMFTFFGGGATHAKSSSNFQSCCCCDLRGRSESAKHFFFPIILTAWEHTVSPYVLIRTYCEAFTVFEGLKLQGDVSCWQTGRKTQLYSLYVCILASILWWAVANQMCEVLKSVHPKQTLEKSSGKVLEGPCGLDEPWVWTALRDFHHSVRTVGPSPHGRLAWTDYKGFSLHALHTNIYKPSTQTNVLCIYAQAGKVQTPSWMI